MFVLRGCLLALVVLSVFPIHSQTATPDSSNETTTFRSNVRRVLLDVVVTDSKDEPVTGLPKENF